MTCTFVVGGARSGKSTYAEQLAGRLSDVHGLSVTYLATAEISDAEMEERIVRHKSQRPGHWITVEEPLEVANWIRSRATPQVILLDCLSLLLNNWMFLEKCNDAQFFARLDELTESIARWPGQIVVVSNEVGLGIVPGDPVTRRYRDWLGLMNQAVARISETAILVVAGIPVDLKKIQVEL